MAEELENVAPPVFVSGIELLRTFFARSAKNFFFAKKKEIGRGILKFFGENGIFSDKYGELRNPCCVTPPNSKICGTACSDIGCTH